MSFYDRGAVITIRIRHGAQAIVVPQSDIRILLRIR